MGSQRPAVFPRKEKQENRDGVRRGLGLRAHSVELSERWFERLRGDALRLLEHCAVPSRFARSRSVGAYVGLTNRRYASGARRSA